MTNLSEYRNLLVFECDYKAPTVNALHELIVDFDIDNDTNLCSHCFYDSKKAPVLEDIASLKQCKGKKNKSLSTKKVKKNKTTKK